MPFVDFSPRKAYLSCMKAIIVIHHHEITLKGENRGMFERQLRRNVVRSLSRVRPDLSVSGGYGRFVISFPGRYGEPAVLKVQRDAVNELSAVFGIANVCLGVEVQQDVNAIARAAEELLESRIDDTSSDKSGLGERQTPFRTIKVDTRRADKNFPMNSMQVNAYVGEYLCKRFNVRANLRSPDETVFIDIANNKAYVYRSKIPGPGGLPVGVSGRVVAVLSAGFDSPVACFRMMKRGAHVVFVHFHSHPYVTRDSVEQVKQLVRVLTKFQFDSRLYVIPFGEAQQEIVAHTDPALRVVLYRRMMIRIAEAIARKENAQALVTGESLGQVASQTLRNIRVIDEAAQLPILRPLVGMDKEEIIDSARKIGTHDISKEPYDDCCSFLTPRNPSTSADPQDVLHAEAKLDIAALTSMCLEKAELANFSTTSGITQETP